MNKYKIIFFVWLIGVCALYFTHFLLDYTPNVMAYEKPVEERPFDDVFIISTDWTPERISQLITENATKYHVKRSVMQAVIDCESYSSTTVQSYVIKNGVREDSWGIAQIYLPAHPEITKKQALDPAFAVSYMAKEMSEGRAYHWSCWRQLYDKK